jgi:uncharacterized protein YegP (UPF0339 family)
MTEQREILKAKRAKFEESTRGLKSYLKELRETAAKHGTDEALVEEDLRKASADLEFYECQVGNCADALADDPVARRTFQVYRDAAGGWRWRLAAGNGRLIAESGEGYQHKQDCLHGIELVKASADAQVEDGE